MNGKTYLNTASCGLLGKSALQNTYDFYDAMLTESSTASEHIRDTILPQVRNTVASFLSAPASRIAFVPNFSWGLNGILDAMKGTEKVLLYQHDYPSLYEPFRIKGFDITWIDTTDGFIIDTELIKEQLLQHDIDVLAISHVQWLTGFKADIEEIGIFCREQDIIFIIDATQSAGAVPLYLDGEYADAVIFSNYKWMNAGFGTGVMYLSEKFMEVYPPLMGGHNSYAMVDNVWKYTSSLRSYEPGHLNLHGLLVLDAAIRQKQEHGIEAIAAHNMLLTQLLLDELRDMNAPLIGPVTLDGRSSIVVLHGGSDVHQYLYDNGIVTTKRDERIRISTHFYNTKEDINRLTECLRTAYKRY
ncbi:aminotransferase class V-fold PLP-dependent enzyme [Chitinophagaceae bacterium MMS25-I14]